MSLDIMSLAFSFLGRYLISPKNGRDLIFMMDSNIESLMTRENDTASAVEMSACKQYCISLYKEQKQNEMIQTLECIHRKEKERTFLYLPCKFQQQNTA